MLIHPSLFQRLAALSFLIITVSSCAVRAPEIDACFSPGGGCISEVAEEIAKAKTDLRIQAHSLNAKAIADAVVKAKEAGVNVQIILDRGAGTAQNNATYFSSLNGIATRLDGRHAVADSNVIIIDKATVITGSFNFTKEAEDRNSENLVVIRSARAAALYLENWNLHHSHAEEFSQAGAQQPNQNAKIEKKPLKKKKKAGKAGTS